MPCWLCWLRLYPFLISSFALYLLICLALASSPPALLSAFWKFGMRGLAKESTLSYVCVWNQGSDWWMTIVGFWVLFSLRFFFLPDGYTFEWIKRAWHERMNEQRKTEMEMNQRERGKKMRRAGSGWVKEISIVGVTRLGEGYIYIYMIKMSRMKE